ncbi:hypothetical protein ACV354_33240, partial [Pseudomonas aeruginosa]
VELFWYDCPHCYEFEPTIVPWSEKLPAYIHFLSLPALLGGIWNVHGQMFMTLEGMGVEHVRRLRGGGQLCRGALRNLAAYRVRGELLLWLDAGSGILDREWLQQLLEDGQPPERGAEGPWHLASAVRGCH